MKFPKFLAGLLVGAFVGLIFWYWQKSTSAEEGALAVLDRLAAAELRVRDLEARLRLAEKSKSNEESSEVLSGLSGLWGLAPAKENQPEQAELSKGLRAPAEKAEEQPHDNLQVINGIGPAYERRLNEAGIVTLADLAQQSPDNLRQITGIKSWHAADPQQWIDAAQTKLQE
jgi:predicted flap endonuclease-1-like 5' DNA nuclease